ncbi:MAG: sodium-dependent transporter [Planctomycetaceae bacterium]|nr:sodium-dependent transporter [Planctomycetaceae bacterium]
MQRERWGSRIGVILAVAGSAVGLGNFLRFPGQAAQNGGGAFMLPYFISLLVLGIPLCWAEWTMGRYGGTCGFNSAPGIYSVIWRNRCAKYFGAIALLLPLVIYMYYVLIEAWCLGYAIQYLTGDLMLGPDAVADDYGAFFANFSGQDADGALLSEGRRHWLWVLAGVFAFNFMLIYRGVTKGIESFCRVAMPLMIVLAVIVLIRVLTLGTPDPSKPEQSVLGGLNFMWNPRAEALLNPQTWLAASGQIFFSLSVGFGIIVNYASYLSEKDDVVLSGLTSSSMNEFFEVCLGGLITLPAAFIFLGAAAGDQGTFGLGFVALPNVFAQMWGGQAFGFLWFFMLFIAAVTSSVSMLQPVIAFLEEGFGLKRHASAAMLGLLSALGCGFVLYFSKGLVALDTMDFWVGSVMIFVLALVQSVLYGWAFGIKRGAEEAHKGANIRIPHFIQLMLKYVVPVYLGVIFVAFCLNTLPSSDTELFPAHVTDSTPLEGGLVPEDLEQQFREQDITLPDDVEIVDAADGTGWEVRGNEDALLYLLQPGAEPDSFVVLQHKPGYVESISRSTAASASVLFLLVVLTFLLLLIHIAGRRWEKAGLLTYGPDPATPNPPTGGAT